MKELILEGRHGNFFAVTTDDIENFRPPLFYF